MVYTGLILGAMLGFVLQRGRFCVTGAYREVWLSGKTRWLTAFLIVIAVQAIGVAALQQFGVIAPGASRLPWLAVIAGALLFGVSIVLAGGCATGTYYRASEGLVGSWIALVGYAVSAGAMKYGALKFANDGLRAETVGLTSIQTSLGISVWVLVGLFVAGTAALAFWHLGQPKLAVATLPARRTGLAHLLLEKPWHPFATALVVGSIAIAAFPLSFASGRKGGLGITTPSANLWNFISTGNVARLDWGVYLVLGLLVGSFIAAKASGEFRIRIPNKTQTLRSIVGGIGMGVGASWAGGCTIGNAMVETAQFTYQGWIAFALMFVGVGIGTRIFIQRPARASQATAVPVPVLAAA